MVAVGATTKPTAALLAQKRKRKSKSRNSYPIVLLGMLCETGQTPFCGPCESLNWEFIRDTTVHAEKDEIFHKTHNYALK
jgi:hypothetical protein